MERKRQEKKENLLPTSLMEDIECDELDKELQFIYNFEKKDSIKNSKYILFNYF